MVRLFSTRKLSGSFDSFVGDVSMRLMALAESEVEPTLRAVFRCIGERYRMDHLVIRWLPPVTDVADGSPLKIAVGWAREKIPEPPLSPADIPWILRRMKLGEAIYLGNLSQLPSRQDRRALKSQNVNSAAVVPLRIDGEVVGVFSLSKGSRFEWTETIRNEIDALALIFANAYWAAIFRRRLQTSEAQFRGVVQDQSDMIVRWTPDGTTTWVNDRVCEYMGMARDEFIGSLEPSFMSEDDRPRFEAAIAGLSPANPTYSNEYRVTLASGKNVWQEWTERGIFDEDGQLTEVQSVGRDITERKMADAELARQTAFRARLAEISSNLLIVASEKTHQVIADSVARIGADYDFDRAILRWHDDALCDFGVPTSWVLDGPPLETTNPEDYPYAYQTLRNGKSYRVDDVEDMGVDEAVDQASFRRKGFRSILCLPLTSEEKILGFVTFACCKQRTWDESTISELQLIAHTITNAVVRQWSMIQLSTREQDLARSQRVAKVGSYRLQATLNDDDDSPDQLEILNVSISEQALQIFGISAQQDPGAQVMSLLAQIHPDDEPEVRRIWRNTLQARTRHTIGYRVVRPDGSVAHIQAREQVDGADSNGVITLFGTFEDITQWVESNQQLQTAVSQIEKLKDRLLEENVLLRDEVRAAHGFDRIVGNSEKLRGILESVRQVAPTDVTVLVSGETGTGKELVARSIHELSDRKKKPMVSVNCAALSVELIESELFGHEKGAFTGAHSRRKGRFEIADGGTLFLDEIAEMSGDLQAKLLRVIQEGEFERLGGSTTLKTDVRLIAATNRNLIEAMDSGEFRADLYYRINSFPIDLPPLRERKEDIPMLAAHLVRKHAKNLGKEVESISARTLRYFQDQEWPGNIRELESVVVRALISTASPILDYAGDVTGRSWDADGGHAGSMSLLDAQRRHIVDVLKKTGWVIEGDKGAALALGLAPSSLRSKMKRLDIVRPG